MATRTIAALAALGLCSILLAQDFSALNVALPSIERDLDADLTTVQWVINAYALVYAMLIVTGGKLADRFGRKRLFLLGAGIFGAMSFAAGAAPDPSWLIAARAAMGVGGALMWPAILGMTYGLLPGRSALAGALIGGTSGIGLAIGPFLGGFLTEAVGWRWVQFVDVPVAALAMAVVWVTVPPDVPVAAREPIDLAGILALSLGLVALLFALDQGADWGWGDPRVLGCLAVAVVALAAVVPLERRAGAAALIPGAVMGNRTFATACVLTGLIAPAYFASLLYPPQVMQKLLGFSPLAAGVGMLPMLGGFAVVSFAAGPLGARVAPSALTAAGVAGIAGGAWLLAGAAGAGGYPALVPGLLAMGIGLGLFAPSSATMALTAIDPARTSLAGGVLFMFQLGGGAVGLAVTTAVVAAVADGAVRGEAAAALGAEPTAAETAALRGLLAGTASAGQVLARFDPAAAERLVAAAGAAFADGIRAGLRLDAGLAALALAIAAAFLARARTTTAGGAPAGPSSTTTPTAA